MRMRAGVALMAAGMMALGAVGCGSASTPKEQQAEDAMASPAPPADYYLVEPHRASPPETSSHWRASESDWANSKTEVIGGREVQVVDGPTVEVCGGCDK